MKRAMPRRSIRRLQVGIRREIAVSPPIAQEARLTAACNLQMSTTRFLQTAIRGSDSVPWKTNDFAIERLALRLQKTLTQDSTFRSDQMADVIFIVVTMLFFIVACLYVSGCDRL